MKNLNIALTYDNPNFENKIIYVFKFIEQHPLCKGNCVFSFKNNAAANIKIHYGTQTQKDNNTFFIPAQKQVFGSKQNDPFNFVPNQYLKDGQTLFALENEIKSTQQFIIGKHFQFDIIETIFFHISRFEEVFTDEKDLNQAGWLDEKKHFLIRHQLQQTPVVDHLVKAFCEALLDQKIEQKTTYDISHDLDILFRLTPAIKLLRSLAANLIYRRGFSDFQKTLTFWWKMQTSGLKDPYDNFEQLLRKENIWKSKQLFLMAGGNTKYDNKYSIEHPYIDEIVKIAENRGYKIGLHPSYNAGFEPKRYAKEISLLSKKLNQLVQLNRQHWLRFNWKITPYLWEKNEIETDYSMGYSQHLGFRCGTGFAYKMYDFKNEKAFAWKEQPMAFMESAAIHFAQKNKLNLSKVMTDFLVSNKFHTHICINFHNSNFDPLLQTGQTISQFYNEELLKIIET